MKQELCKKIKHGFKADNNNNNDVMGTRIMLWYCTKRTRFTTWEAHINASKHKKLQKQQSWMRFNQKWSKSCIIKNIREFFLSAIKFNYTELQGELQLVMRTVTCEKATICTSTTFNLLPFSSSLSAAKRSWVINMQEWLTYWSDCIFIKKFKYRKEDGKSKTASVGHEDLWYVTWVCCII